jgi:hemoglobin
MLDRYGQHTADGQVSTTPKANGAAPAPGQGGLRWVALPYLGAACHRCTMQTVYEAAGGADGLLGLANAWHARVMADEVVSHAFSHGMLHPEHTQRLAAYWVEALGGPRAFSATYGDETSVVRMHSGNGPHEEMDRRAIACFDQALADVGIATINPLHKVLHDYFAWAATTTMSRYRRSAGDVPAGLHIPQWSWDGLVGEIGPDGK